jgi:stage II sporulation protein R
MQMVRYIRRFSWILGFLLIGFWIALSLIIPSRLQLPFSAGEIIQGQVASGDIQASAGLIRLHVIANSDSLEDQALKYQVRDTIVAELSPKLKHSQGIEESRQIVQANLARLEELAEATIANAGYAYKVKAEVGNFDFPTRSYGEIILPAGRYEAVRVVIGSGEGANWWCVLFPPLCFINVSTGLAAAPEGETAIAAEIEVGQDAPGVEALASSTTSSVESNRLNMSPDIDTENVECPKIRCKVLDWWNSIWKRL